MSRTDIAPMIEECVSLEDISVILPSMRFEKSVEERLTVIKLLEEKLDTRISPSLKSEFINLNALGIKNIVLNLQDVRYADSSGLSSILTANRLCASLGGVLVLCCVSTHVDKLIKISQLDTVLNVLPTEAEAREAIYMFELENEIAAEDEDETAEATDSAHSSSI
ncbi:MAG: STAS domain-containing protein [Bacteroidia bacterium]|nr:STAS domain-containing protein [Bacteroidia bacterium]